MASGLERFNSTFRGLSQFSLRRLSDGLLYNIPPAQNININDGIEQKEQMGRNDLGEEVRLFSFPGGRKGTAEVTFTQMQPELMALRQGVQLEEKNYTARVPFKFLANRGEIPGATVGYAGYGISEDINLGEANAPIASIKPFQMSIPLEQRAFADHANWRGTAGGFAIGENRAIRVSDDIVAAGHIVTMEAPVSGLMSLFSDKSVGVLAVSGVVVNCLDEVGYLTIGAATIDLSDSGMDLGADSVSLKLFLNYIPGTCRTWNLASPKTQNKVACVADA